MEIKKFAEMIKESNNIVFFGGAGVSTESGLKDYRSEDGMYRTLWQYGVTPETILSHDFFFEKTDVFYSFYRKYFVTDVEPNRAHKALAELEKMGKLKAVVTQNIDGLHQKGGSRNVIELHGTARGFYCTSCYEDVDNALDEIIDGQIPRCKLCNGIAKPKVVLYDEPLNDVVAEKAMESIMNADMLIVGGTSMVVFPASAFVEHFHGNYTVMINKDETMFDGNADLIFRENIGEVFDKVMKEIGLSVAAGS